MNDTIRGTMPREARFLWVAVFLVGVLLGAPARADFRDNLVMWYSFNTNGGLLDFDLAAATPNPTGTIFTAASFGKEVLSVSNGGLLYLNGSVNSVLNNSNSWSVWTRVRRQSPTNIQDYLLSYAAAGNSEISNRLIEVRMDSESALLLGIGRTNNSFSAINTFAPVDSTAFMTIGMSYDAVAGRFIGYLNGEAKTNTLLSGEIAGGISGDFFRVGQYKSGFGSRTLRYYDELRIYSAALSPEQFAAIETIPEPSVALIASVGAAVICLLRRRS